MVVIILFRRFVVRKCWYQTPFFLTPLNLLVSLKAARELHEEGRKETKIPFNSKLYYWVWRLFYGRRNFSWNQWKWLRLPDHVLKYESFSGGLSSRSLWYVQLVSSIEAATKGDATCPLSPRPEEHVCYLLAT